MSDDAKTKPMLMPNTLPAKTRVQTKADMGKPMRRINPLGMRVVVQLRKEESVSEGGLYLPEGSKQNMTESLLAEVIEVATATDNQTEDEANISGIPLGALVLIPKHAGVKVPWDESLRIIETKEVLATINEIQYV